MRKPTKPPKDQIPTRFLGDPEKLTALMEAARAVETVEYGHWDDFRRKPTQSGFTPEELWSGIKLLRKSRRVELPLSNASGVPATYCPHDGMAERCHRIDMEAIRRIERLTEDHEDRFYISSLIEEAVTSSILEGASTTAAEGAEMIRTGRRPKNRDDRMVLNNYRAMKLIGEMRHDALTPEMVLRIHETITHDTLDDAGAEGRFRKTDEAVNVRDLLTGEILHTPPPAGELEGRVERMCTFANQSESTPFIHPVVRSIVLHYWLAYDHPFVDGNGRTARALFYWSMLHRDYRQFQFVSISPILLNAPAKYGRAFLLTQSDGDDLTYFILHQLGVIERAVSKFEDYFAKKSEEIARVQQILDDSSDVSRRQCALLGHALRHPGFQYTIRSHKNSHGVAYQTARQDLLDLAAAGYLDQTKHGKTFYFRAPNDLVARIDAKRRSGS